MREIQLQSSVKGCGGRILIKGGEQEKELMLQCVRFTRTNATAPHVLETLEGIIQWVPGRPHGRTLGSWFPGMGQPFPEPQLSSARNDCLNSRVLARLPIENTLFKTKMQKRNLHRHQYPLISYTGKCNFGVTVG